MSVSPNGVSFDLGGFSTAMGSAELLANGNYFFLNPLVVVNLSTIDSLQYGNRAHARCAAIRRRGCDLEHRRSGTIQSLADA